MQKFLLRGLAEGLAGRTTVVAHDLDDVFAQLPVLNGVRDKLIVTNNTISGFCACDG